MKQRPKQPHPTPTPVGRGRWALAGIAVLAFACAVYFQLPAALVLRVLPSPLPEPWSVAPGGAVASGTIWEGELAGLSLLGHPVGRVRWQLSPYRALGGRWVGQVEVTRQRPRSGVPADSAGRLAANFDLDRSGTGTVTALDGEWPLADLQPATVVPWRGRVVAKVDRLQFAAGEWVGGSGQLVLRGLANPGSPVVLGDFEGLWPAGNARGVPSVRVRDLAGPVALQATLTREPNGAWQLLGDATLRADAPMEVRQALLMFGPPDSSGRYPLRLEFGLSPRP